MTESRDAFSLATHACIKSETAIKSILQTTFYSAFSVITMNYGSKDFVIFITFVYHPVLGKCHLALWYTEAEERAGCHTFRYVYYVHIVAVEVCLLFLLTEL